MDITSSNIYAVGLQGRKSAIISFPPQDLFLLTEIKGVILKPFVHIYIKALLPKLVL